MYKYWSLLFLSVASCTSSESEQRPSPEVHEDDEGVEIDSRSLMMQKPPNNFDDDESSVSVSSNCRTSDGRDIKYGQPGYDACMQQKMRQQEETRK